MLQENLWTTQSTGRSHCSIPKPVPEFPPSAIEPEALLINDFTHTRLGKISADCWWWGQQSYKPQRGRDSTNALDIYDYSSCLSKAGRRLYNGVGYGYGHCALAQPKANVRYVLSLLMAITWDLASALHPQTLMAYQKKWPAPVGWQWCAYSSSVSIKLGSSW